MVFFTWLMKCLFGKGTVFEPDEHRDVSLTTGRLFVRLEWITYTRWGGLFRFYLRKTGLLKVTMAYNPGVPEFEFKASCSSTEYPDYIVLGNKAEISSDEFAALEAQLGELEELPHGVYCLQWRCVTVVRSAEDLMELFEWLDNVDLTLSDEAEYFDDDSDSWWEDHELDLIEDTMSMLTERFSECQLNS